MFKAEGEIKTRQKRHFLLSASTEWRDEDSSDTGRTQGLRIGTALSYHFRRFRLKAGWDTYMLERSNTDTTSTDFFVKINRRF